MTLAALVTALMLSLSPRAAHTRDGRAIAAAIVEAVEHDPQPPVFGSREADASVLVYTAWAESRWRLHAEGDGHRSHGAFQVQRPAGLGTATEQARAALGMLHVAAHACPDLPMAAYLSGSCRMARAQAGQRMNAVARLVARVFVEKNREKERPIAGSVEIEALQ